MHRKVLGFIALGLLVVGMGWEMLGRWTASANDPETPQTLAGALVRIGLVVGAVWLAAPQTLDQINWRGMLPRLGLVTAIVASVLMPRVARPLIGMVMRFGPAIVAAGFVTYLLKPPKRSRTPQR